MLLFLFFYPSGSVLEIAIAENLYKIEIRHPQILRRVQDRQPN